MPTGTSSATQIIHDIETHIQKEGSPWRTWYVGIAADPRERLFVDHNVREKGDWWIHRNAGTSAAAREVEQYFLKNRGTDGGPGGGSTATRHVYAYRKAGHTKP